MHEEFLVRVPPEVEEAITVIAKLRDFDSRASYIRYLLRKAIAEQPAELETKIKREIAKLRKERGARNGVQN